MNNQRKQIALVVGIFLVVIIGIATTLYILRQRQNVQQNASGPLCPTNGASCSWDVLVGATKYHYVILDVDSSIVIKEGDTTDGNETSVNFTSEAGKTYKCSVNPIGICNNIGTIKSVTQTCSVIPSITPTTTPPICQNNISTCAWDNAANADHYHYKIVDSSGNLIKEGDTTDASQTSITFPSQPGNTYTCTVSAANVCGNTGNSGSATQLCAAPSGTPIPTETPAPSVTPMFTVTPLPTVTPVPTDTPIPTESPTPTPTNNPTPTLTPTSTPTPTTLPTPTPTTPAQPAITVIVQQNQNPPQVNPPQKIVVVITQPRSQPKGTIPPTGPSTVVLGVGIAGAIIAVVGALVFFIL